MEDILSNKTRLRTSSSISEFPTMKYSKYLMNNTVVRKRFSHLNNSISFDELAKNVARIQIFYDELQETIISEEIKTQPFDLVSNLGGTLGLFLGLSFLSLIEIFEILFKVLFICIEKSGKYIN